MSHFDDIDFIFWGDSPKTVLGLALFLAIAGGACWWAYLADENSAKTCAAHGEKYIDARSDYTLCEQDGGAVIKR